MKGLYKIKAVIKDDLDYFMNLPYVMKFDVVKVVLNKIDSEPKTYRYRGKIFIGNDTFEHDKAFNTQPITWTQIMKGP